MTKQEAQLKIEEMLTIEDTHKDELSELLEIVKSYEHIIINGAGWIGKQTQKILNKVDITPICFLDIYAKNGQMLGDIPVYRPETDIIPSDIKTKTLVLLCFQMSKDIFESVRGSLLQLGYCNIINGFSLFCKDMFYSSKTESKLLHGKKDEILFALNLLEDNHSRDVFCSAILCHLTQEFENFVLSKDTIQYFDINVPLSKGYKTFIDCGAYTGDSFADLIKMHQCDTYIGFEPDLDNFKFLSENVHNNSDKLNHLCLYPVGTGNNNSFCNFSYDGMMSRVSDDGSCIIQIVKLDDALVKINPTMIKMDIEGAEVDTLLGAEKMITSYKPDLAISVYHKLSDYYVIPALLKKFVPEYKFYLRGHKQGTIDTVLYATI